MAAVGLALSWCVFDLAARASDPYDIHSRQRITQPGESHGHGERGLTTPNPGQLGLLPKAEVEAAVWIIWRESGGRTTAKNPRSSSHGLNGFISRSWVSMTKRHGIKHSLEPRAQILALYHYCNDRYGSMSAAKAHHVARRWY